MQLYAQIIPHFFGARPNYFYSVDFLDGLCAARFGAGSQLRALDLGSGFGAQAIALAERGHLICCVDNSPNMNALFRTGLAECDEDIRSRIRLFEDDWFSEGTQWRREKEYRLVYSLGNTVSLCGDLQRLRRLFELAQYVLVEGGLFAFDYYSFDHLPVEPPLNWSEPINTDVPGRSFTKAFSKKDSEDRLTSVVTLHVKWDGNGQIQEQTEDYVHLRLNSSIVAKLARESGFHVIAGHDQYERKAATKQSKSILWVLEKKIN